jgi:uncharacterized protein involved in exopolysaccharide biosynthesis
MMALEPVPVAIPVHPLRAPIEPRGSGQALQQLLIVIFKWRRLIFGLALAFTVAAAIAMLLKPVTVTAVAKVLLKPDRIALKLTDLTPEWARLPHWPQMLQSEVQLMKSPEVVTAAARQLLRDSASPEGPVTAADIADKASALADDLVAVPVPDTNLIQMSYAASDGGEAVKVLGVIVEKYLHQHARANSGSQELLKFYEAEGERVRRALQSAEDALKAWQEREQVVNVATEIGDLLSSLSDRQKALRQTNAEMQATAARIATLEQIHRGEPVRRVTLEEQIRNPLLTKLEGDLAAAEVATRDVDKHPVVQKLRTDLTAAEVALQDLRLRYTDEDRHVREKQEQVGFLRKQLEGAQRDVEQDAQARVAVLRRELAAARQQAQITGRQTSEFNVLREDLEKSLSTARAQLTALGAQKTVLAGQIDDLTRAVGAMRAKKVEVDRRQRDVDTRRDAFVLYSKKLEEARIASGLERQDLSTVAVVEQPHIEGGSDLRRRALLVLVATLVGLALGMALAFGLEFMNDSLRTPGDVEHYLGVPVLAAIPDAGRRALPVVGGTAVARVS